MVCGLSGSGKTTLIRSFVKHRTGKIVVLVNDFGAAGGIRSGQYLEAVTVFRYCYFVSFNQASIEVVRAADAVVNSPFTPSIFMAPALWPEVASWATFEAFS